MSEKTRQSRRARRVRESATYAVARISVWGHEVGAVAEDAQGAIAFEYDERFRASGLELSPIHLPLSTRGPIAFPELRRVASFAGLPGLLADSLPDAFGNAVIRRYFEAKGTPDAALSPVQKLLYIGSRAMGALEFHPALDRQADIASEEALTVARLVEEARRVITGEAAVAIPEMMHVGASAGGARAKALILWDRGTGHVRSAFAPAAAGDEPWMIKFDGVSGGVGGHAMEGAFAAGPYGRIEYAYAQLAREAGIDMPETHLLREREFAHFMVRRFDREPSGRVHMHSLGGLLHADYSVRGERSYEDYFRTIRQLGMGQPAVDEAYRRMIFNLAARNQDDHVKNLAFLMDRDGRWRLAPAFDVTWAVGGRWAQRHQMTVCGKDDAFTRDDLLSVGRAFDVTGDGAPCIEAVAGALLGWREAARAAGLAPQWVDNIEASFRRFA